MKYLPYPGFIGKITMKKYFCLAALLALFAIEAQAGTATVISKLYGVTGDGGTPSETLFELDMTDASSTFVLTLGNGDDGEEIAYNPDDGLIYHASGSTSKVLETIDPATLTVTGITASGDWTNEISGLTYAGSGELLASHRFASEGLSSITTAAVYTNIGATDAALTGLAFIGTTLYAVDKSDDLLRTIDPATGGTLGSVTITLATYTISGATGLATNPVDNTLWALLKVSDTPTVPAARALATIDSATGVATLVGITDNSGLAGIAFESGTAITVTSSVGTASGSITPLGAQTVISGHTTSFTLTPDTGYVIASIGGTCGGSLVDDIFTTAAVTADCTVVANFEFEPTTKLYGITGDGGIPAETLFRLDMSDASSTLFLTLGNGNDGEEIAFNRDNGLLYHASGQSTGSGADEILETIDLVSKAVTPVPLSGFKYKEVTGLTYAGSGILLAGDRTTAVGLSSITTGGVTTNIGETDMTLMGLAYIGTTLYAVGKSDDLLRTIDPATGATLGSVTITLSGFTVSGATGLTTNPDDNSLWALLKAGGSEPSTRALATVDPATGVATLVGITDVPGMAGIAFEFIPCATCLVTPSVGVGPGTISPSTVQGITSGDTTQFTLTPAANHHSDSVGGTCGGTLVGDTFTTAAITADCTVVANFAIDTFTVTSSVGTPSGNINPLGGQSIVFNTTTQFTLTPDTNYHIESVGGTCGGSLVNNTYTTAAITADCTVVANFAIDTFTVTPSVGTPSGSISPLGPQTVNFGATTAFTLTPAANFHIASVGGTCGGSLVSNTYTTAAIIVDCTVVANFTVDTFDLTYTAGAGGSISGTTPQTVDYGTDGTEVNAVPNPTFHFVDWSDAVATALRTDTNVMADINVTANFAIDTFTVTSSVGTPSGSISPLGGQSVDSGSTTQFTLTPDPNYKIDSVGGTCGGSLEGSTYTTAAINADCTVVANFAIEVFTVTSSVGTPAGSISPLGGQPIDSGTTTQFTLTPDPNYHIDSVGGTCGGSLDGDTFTTALIAADRLQATSTPWVDSRLISIRQHNSP